MSGKPEVHPREPRGAVIQKHSALDGLRAGENLATELKL